MADTSSLILHRCLEGVKASVRSSCPKGAITLLVDEGGADIGSYEILFLGKRDGSVSALQGSQSYDFSAASLIGFNEVHSGTLTAPQFLESAGYSKDEIESILDFYDLRRTSYLHCSQLSETAARQLSLLALQRSNSDVWIMRDPFLPFSGRWREHFAKVLLDDAIQKGRTVICTRVSFVPQCWQQSGSLMSIDIGRMAEQARERALREQEMEARRQREREQQEPPSLALSAPQSDAAAGEMKEVPLVAGLGRYYKATYDWIFDPLASLSSTLRTHAWSVGTLGLAGIAILMYTMLFPNLGSLQERIAGLRFDRPAATEPLVYPNDAQKTDDASHEPRNEVPESNLLEQPVNIEGDEYGLEAEESPTWVAGGYSFNELESELALLIRESSDHAGMCQIEPAELSCSISPLV